MVQYLGVAKETTFRTFVSPTHWFNIRTESLKPEKEPLLEETVAYRTPTIVGEPPYKVTGDVEMVVEPRYFGILLEACLGSVTTSEDNDTSPVAYKHEFVPATTLPSLSLEVGVENPDMTKQVFGVGVTSIEIEATAGELVTATVSFLGSGMQVGSSLSTPTFSDVSPFAFHKGEVRIGGTTVGYVESITVSIENDIADDAFVIGKAYLPELVVGGLTVSGSMDIWFKDTTEMNRFLSGSTSGTALDESVPETSLELIFTGESTGSTVAGFEDYTLKIEIPQLVYTAYEMGIDRREKKVQSIDFRGVGWDTETGKPIKVTLINTQNTP